MNKVNMEGDYDCGAACLAMALGRLKSSDMTPILGYDPSTSTPVGVSDPEMLAILYSFGKRCRLYATAEKIAEHWDVPVESLSNRSHILTMSELQAKLGASQKGCAIVGVPSLNGYEYGHYVYCERGELYDPTPHPKMRYNGSARSLPLELVIFIEDEDYAEPL